jgi:hypothetical protein
LLKEPLTPDITQKKSGNPTPSLKNPNQDVALSRSPDVKQNKMRPISPGLIKKVTIKDR